MICPVLAAARVRGVPACRAAAGGPSTQGALVVSSTLSPPAGVSLADACIAPGGGAVLARTSTGALLMVSLDGQGAARPSGPPAAAAAPSTAELDDPTLPRYPLAVECQAVAEARSSPRGGAAAAEAGALAGDVGAGEADAGGQAGAGPAAVGGSGGAGATHTGGTGNGLCEAAGTATAGPGVGSQSLDHAEEVEDRGPWDVSDQAWVLVVAADMDIGAGWRSGSARAFAPLLTAFHAGGAVAMSAAEHQPLLATLGRDNVLR